LTAAKKAAPAPAKKEEPKKKATPSTSKSDVAGPAPAAAPAKAPKPSPVKKSEGKKKKPHIPPREKKIQARRKEHLLAVAKALKVSKKVSFRLPRLTVGKLSPVEAELNDDFLWESL
jgi:hypothetical protein